MLFSQKHSCFMIQPTSAAFVSMETLKLSFKECLHGYIFLRETSWYFAVDLKTLFNRLMSFRLHLLPSQYQKIP